MQQKSFGFALSLLLLIGCGEAEGLTKSIIENFREKRQVNGLPLVYPYGGTYKLLIGFAAPVHNEDHINLLFSANYQYQYVQFQNISQLSQYYFINTVSREQREADLESRGDERIVFYKSVADLLDMKGMNGQDCVLRAICEAAQYPVHEEALVGEILHILLTFGFALSLLLLIGCGEAEGLTKSIIENFREKRQVNGLPLVYPYGGTYKLLIGFAAPVHNEDHINLLFSANYQYQYVQFQNISQLSQYYFINTVSREQREADLESRGDERIVFYKSVADLLDMKGMNGQDCVLRAICEAAQYPVHEEALVGEILHILLTPDYGHSPFEELDPAWQDAMSLYMDAATAGRQMFDCGYIYSDCPQGEGILDIISTLRDE